MSKAIVSPSMVKGALVAAAGVLIAAAILSYGRDVEFINKLREGFDT